ncbi:TPA: DUF1351 domain-containing protein [Enterococcus faecium]|uniref:DUF1351 domain-containing protein n=1 Tax=Enterococcus TaxID=1350 RepID=UPI000E0544AB|nr:MULTISPECIES: DUF1351 domain-containing protein [Enterococcus]MEB4597864.1 DUF1351 domain-containing protein [Enterococcus sp. E4-85]RBS57503.1 hypothetical protein EB35_00937 [Enterococcus faecium]
MTNELSTELLFDVEYTPSIINITNEDQLALLINATVQKYDNLIFKESDIADAKKARKELKRIFTLIDDKRKEVKKDFNEPLKSFEEKIKEYSTEIQMVSNKIDSQIKEFEEKTKENRKTIVLAELTEQATNYGLEVSEIELKSSWLNSSNFTAKNKLTKKIEQEILAECIEIKQRKDAREQNKKLVESYAKANKLEPQSWVMLIDEGLTAANIFPKIDVAAKEVLDQEQRELEKEEAEIKQDLPNKTAVEVHKELHAEESADEPTYSFTLNITGTAKQISIIKKTIEDLGVKYQVEMNE